MNNEKHVRNSFYNGSRIDDIEANENRGPAGPQGLPGFSPRASVTLTENGARIIITDKNGTTYADITNGRNGVDGNNGSNGFSPIAEVAEVEDGAQLTVIDNRGTTKALIRNGERGERGEQGIQGPAGKQGQPGKQGIQGPAGADGFSPTVEVTETTNGHTVKITDKDGLHSFEVTNGKDGKNGKNGENGQNGSDGAAATISIGNVETLPEGSRAYVRNTGNDNAAVFDFGIPQGIKGPKGEQGIQGIQGEPGPSNVTTILTSGTAIADINGTTIYAPEGGSSDEYNGNHVYTILSTRNVGPSVNIMTNQFKGTIPADTLEAGDIIYVVYYGSDKTDATLEVTLNHGNSITAPILYRDVTNNFERFTAITPELRAVNNQINDTGVLKLQYWPARTYVYSTNNSVTGTSPVYNESDMFLLMDLDGMYLLNPAVNDMMSFSTTNIFSAASGERPVTWVDTSSGGIKCMVKNQIPYTTGYIGFRLGGPVPITSGGSLQIAFRFSEGRGNKHIEKLCIVQYNNNYYPGYLHISDKACYIVATGFAAGTSISSNTYIGIIS